MSHRRLGTAMTGRRTPYRVKLKTDLNAAFEAISLTGKFAGWEALPRAPPAWLYVDGVGDISMPLGEEQIMQIIGKAQQTPYGSTTPEEPDVGGPVGNNIWELNPDQLEFLDPEWPNYLLMLRDLVESKLDVDGPIRLNFHRMMIFGKGAMSTPQTDIQRTRGMFGTLMICLPSAHEGGEVRVEHNGESMVLGGSDASQSFSCWYSDVTHEILPVKSGYRCVLTYNLATRPDLTPPTASALDLKKLPLRNTLESWIKDLASKKTSKVPSHLYQVLDHEYFEPPTCMKEFNDKDLARVHLLEGFQPELPFEILLASLEKNEQGPITREYQRKRLESDNSGSDRSDSEQYDSDWDSMAEYHELDEVEDVEYCVKSLRTLDGTIIASSCDLNLNFCLAADPFENLNEPSEECFDDFACHVFRTSALVIVPHQKIGEYLAHCAHESEIPRSTSQDETLFGECQSALRFLGHICSDLPLQISMLDAMCILFVSASKTTFRKLDAAVILQIALQYSHYTLFQTVGLDHKGRLTISFFEWAKELLSSCPDADRAEKYQTWIPFLILSFPSMDDRIRIIEAISNPSDDAAGHEAESDLWRSSGLKLESATPSSEKIRNITKMSDHSLPTSIGYFRGPGPTGPDVVLPKSSTWTQDMIRRSIVRFPETSNRPTVTDGEYIVSALFGLDEDWADVSALLISIFERSPQVHATAFLLAILSQLSVEAAAANIPTSAIAELRRSLSVRVFNDESKLSRIITPTKIKWVQYGRPVSPPSWDKYLYSRDNKSTSETGLVVTSEALVNFACGLINLSVDTENLLERFIQKISEQCGTFSVDDMHLLWMPFLYGLIPALVLRSVSLDTPTYQELARRLITHCYDTTVGPQPEVFDVPSPEVNCTCTNCVKLNEFLRNPSQGTRRFNSLSKVTRRHLDERLGAARIRCNTALDSGAFVVTKLCTLELDLDAWKKRQQELYLQVTSNIEQEHLQCLLGVDEAARIQSTAGPVEGPRPQPRYASPPRRPAHLTYLPPSNDGSESHSEHHEH